MVILMMEIGPKEKFTDLAPRSPSQRPTRVIGIRALRQVWVKRRQRLGRYTKGSGKTENLTAMVNTFHLTWVRVKAHGSRG